MDCLECEGQGHYWVFEHDDYYEYTCVHCDGIGEIEDDSDQ